MKGATRFTRLPDLNREIVENMFACPVCNSGMTVTEDGRSIVCEGEKRHCWDIARSGYVNFSGQNGGDSVEAVVARRRFLEGGYYTPTADAVAGLLGKYKVDGTVVDAGCGEGFYDERICASGYRVCGFDLSKTAVDYAARRHNPLCAFVVGGIFRMPLKTGSAGAVVSIFAPCAAEEMFRVLKPGGILIVAGAGETHLSELKRVLYGDRTTENAARADLPDTEPDEKLRLKYGFRLESREAIQALFSMTPYYYRTSREDAAKLSGVGSLDVDADIDIFVFRKGSQ